MTSSDKYSFADKLRENVIPDDVLEARNVRRSILPETQQTLPALEKEAQADIARHDHEGEQAQIALAPYERLPEDLLLKIFLYLSEEVSLPPVFTQFPWILGRVCSYWRSISRNDSRLWGCLAFKLPSQSNYLPILPPGARISIEYASDSNFDLLLPVLNRCKILKLSGSISSFDSLWKTIPHDAFFNLRTLSIYINDIRRDNPEPDWAFTAKPFHMATQLRSVSLRVIDQWTKTLMSLGIPWNQLKYLEVESPGNIALYRVLQKCNSVVELCLSAEKPPQSALESTDDLYFPHLRKLDVSAFEIHPWIPPLSNWEHLTFLRLLGTHNGNDLQFILKKCMNLKELDLLAPKDFPPKPLNMPFLRSLHIKTFALSRQPPLHNFILPGLEELTITDSSWPDSIRLLDSSTVLDMLEASHCSLSSFKYFGSSRSLLDLTSISTITSVIFPYSVFPAHILHDIGLGILLPNFNTLICIPKTVDAMLDMLEARANREAQVRGNGASIIMHILAARRRVSEIQLGCLHDLHSKVSGQIDTTISIELEDNPDGTWGVALADNAKHLTELMPELTRKGRSTEEFRVRIVIGGNRWI